MNFSNANHGMERGYRMRRYFKRFAVIIMLVVAVLFIYYFRHYYICDNNLYAGFFGSILATIFAAFLAWVVWEQWNKTNITSSADFIHKLTEAFFKPETRILITLIECDALEFKPEIKSGDDVKAQPYFEVNTEKLAKSITPDDLRTKLINRDNNEKLHYTVWEIDDMLISPLTDVGMLEMKGVVEFPMVYVGFRYYLKLVWNCNAIKKYIQWQRDDANTQNIKHAVSYPFKNIAEKCLEYEVLPDDLWLCRKAWFIQRQILGRRPDSKIDILKSVKI